MPSSARLLSPAPPVPISSLLEHSLGQHPPPLPVTDMRQQAHLGAPIQGNFHGKCVFDMAPSPPCYKEWHWQKSVFKIRMVLSRVSEPEPPGARVAGWSLSRHFGPAPTRP